MESQWTRLVVGKQWWVGSAIGSAQRFSIRIQESFSPESKSATWNVPRVIGACDDWVLISWGLIPGDRDKDLSGEDDELRRNMR